MSPQSKYVGVALLWLLAGSAVAQDYSLIQFLSIQSATAPHFAPNGRDIVYTANITGVPQIWGMGVLGSYQKQITFDTNGVAGASTSSTWRRAGKGTPTSAMARHWAGVWATTTAASLSATM